MALGHLGVGKAISDIDTDRSREGLACKLFFATSLDQALRDFDWGFARRNFTLGLVASDPTDEWAFSYRYPSDCLAVRKIWSGLRNDTRQTRVSYEINSDSAGRLILTDQDSAWIKYTARITDPNRWTPDFIMAHSLLLATYIAPQMTGGDPFKMSPRALELYRYMVENAKASSANEEQFDEEPESQFVRERE